MEVLNSFSPFSPLSFAVGDKVVSVCRTYYPGKVGIVKSVQPTNDREVFPGGFAVTVEIVGVPGLCAFDVADLKLGEGGARGRGLRIHDVNAASAAALEMRGSAITVDNTGTEVTLRLNPGGYLAIAVERYRDTGVLLPGVAVVPCNVCKGTGFKYRTESVRGSGKVRFGSPCPQCKTEEVSRA